MRHSQVRVAEREGWEAQCWAASKRQRLMRDGKLAHEQRRLSKEKKRNKVQQQTRRMGSKGALSVGRSDTAEESYIVTPKTVGDIPGTTRRDSLWSRERRVSCSAIAEHGITKGRQRYTDCYAAIPLACIAGA
jgi:hypothetical protein